MHKEGSLIFNGGIELSNREEPQTQLMDWTVFNGYPLTWETPEAFYSLQTSEDGSRDITLRVDYQGEGHYQVKWWVMLPFSEEVYVDDEPIDIYQNQAKEVKGLRYGNHWTRARFFTVKENMKVQVGGFTFTIHDSNVKELMIYRRLDNSLIELAYLWWNVDRYGEIPPGTYHAQVELTIDGEIPPQVNPSLFTRIKRKIGRMLRNG